MRGQRAQVDVDARVIGRAEGLEAAQLDVAGQHQPGRWVGVGVPRGATLLDLATLLLALGASGVGVEGIRGRRGGGHGRWRGGRRRGLAPKLTLDASATAATDSERDQRPVGRYGTWNGEACGTSR